MKIAIGSDHAGFAAKEEIKKYLEAKGFQVEDKGCYSEESVHYPQYGAAVAKAVQSGEAERGVLICGTGIGMSMAANKVKGIRAAACSETFSAKYTRMHNDANILCLGGRVVGPGVACEMVDLFIDTPYEGGRHDRRVAAVMAIEKR